MPRLIQAGESSAARRRLYFQLVGADGISPATGETGGQPEVSIDGAAWTGAGSIGTLSHVGNGRCHATLDPSAVLTAGAWIESRYRSGNTAECPGDSAFVVSYDPADGDWSEDEREQLLGAAAAILAAGPTITVANPAPADGGTRTVVRGDSYTATVGRPLRWNSATGLDLASAVIVVRIYPYSPADNTLEAEVPVVVTGSTGAWILSASLTSAHTQALSVDRHRIEPVATFGGTEEVTLLRGLLSVEE